MAGSGSAEAAGFRQVAAEFVEGLLELLKAAATG
jgi:hypothetical protein